MDLLVMFVSSQNLCQSPNPQCDSIRRWDLWEVLRVPQGHEGRTLIIGFVFL